MLPEIEENMDFLLIGYIKGDISPCGKILVKSCMEMRDDIRETYCTIHQLAGWSLEQAKPVATGSHQIMLEEIMAQPSFAQTEDFNSNAKRRRRYCQDDIFPPTIQQFFDCTSETVCWENIAPGIDRAKSPDPLPEDVNLWKIEPDNSLTRIMTGKTACLVVSGYLWAIDDVEPDCLLVHGDIGVESKKGYMRYRSGCDGNTIVMTCEADFGSLQTWN